MAEGPPDDILRFYRDCAIKLAKPVVKGLLNLACIKQRGVRIDYAINEAGPGSDLMTPTVLVCITFPDNKKQANEEDRVVEERQIAHQFDVLSAILFQVKLQLRQDKVAQKYPPSMNAAKNAACLRLPIAVLPQMLVVVGKRLDAEAAMANRLTR